MKKIAIGLPHVGTFNWRTVMALLSLEVPKGYQIAYHMVGSCLIYDARQRIVDFAKDNGCEYVVMFDDDMIPPADFLIKTIKTLDDNDKIHIVTGKMFKRIPPFPPCFYTKVQYNMDTQKPYLESPVEFPDEGLLPLQGLGLANCVIKMTVFDIIDEKRQNQKGDYFYPLPNMGEDLTFSLIALKCGVNMVCDLSIDVGHVGDLPVFTAHYRECYEEFKKRGDGKLFKDCEVQS